jgi:N-acetylneuraminic acid mutarotase
VERFDPVAGKWEAVAPMGSRRAGLGVAVLEGKLYAVGGHEQRGLHAAPRGHLSSVERFDPVAGKWEAVASMISRRRGLGVTVLEGKLYAAGGHDGSNALSSVERFDPVAGKWEAVASMGTLRNFPSVTCSTDSVMDCPLRPGRGGGGESERT